MIGFLKNIKLSAVVHMTPLIISSWATLFGLVAILLVLIEQLYLANFLVVFVPLAVFTAAVLLKSTDNSETKKVIKKTIMFDVLMLLFVLGWVAFNAHYTTQHLFIDRDPGFYENTAVWLADNPGLDFYFKNVFGDDARVDGPGFNELAGKQYVQGAHVLPALLGMVGQIIGITLMFKSVAIIGGAALLAFYSFARRIVHPKWAMLGTALLSIELPFLYFSRDSYTEPLSLLAIFSGLAVLYLAQSQKTNRAALWLLAGLIFMVSVMVRIDGIMFAAAMIGIASLSYAHSEGRNSLRNHLLMVAPMLLGIALLYYDVIHFSAVYYNGHGHLMKRLMLLTACATIAGVIYVLLVRKTKIVDNIFKHFENVKLRHAVIMLAALVGLFMTTRSLWYNPRFTNGTSTVERVQEIEGLDLDNRREYGELTTNWLEAYLGPVLFALAGVGILISLWRMMKGESKRQLAFYVLFFIVASIYLWKPSITPDHIWASRRMLPVVMPALVLFGVLGLEYLYPKLIKKTSKLLEVGIFVLITGFLAAPNITLARPFVSLAAHQQHATVNQVCASVEGVENPAILFVGLAGNYLSHATRIMCDVETSNFKLYKEVNGRVSYSSIEKAVSEAASQGYTPHLAILGDNFAFFENWQDLNFIYVADIGFGDVEQTLVRTPSKRSHHAATLHYLDLESIGITYTVK